MNAAAADDITPMALRTEAEVRLRAGQITEHKARSIIREGRPDPLATLAVRQTLQANSLAAALRELHSVCLAMDAEDEQQRPTEAEYQAAMQAAERALARH